MAIEIQVDCKNLVICYHGCLFKEDRGCKAMKYNILVLKAG